MSNRNRYSLSGAIIGSILGLLLGVLVGSVLWFRNNPSMSEVVSAIEENLNLSEHELEKVAEMVTAGAIIDLVIHLMFPTLLGSSIGVVFGALGGWLWSRAKGLPSREQEA
jgi:hypothetical protein